MHQCNGDHDCHVNADSVNTEGTLIVSEVWATLEMDVIIEVGSDVR